MNCMKGTLAKLTLLLPTLLLALQACTSIPIEQRADKRVQIDREAAETIEKLVEQDPAIAAKLESAAGYFVSRVSAAQVAVLGGGQGIGVLVENRTGDRTYMNLKRFDLGAGLGVRYFRVLMIIENQERLEDIRNGNGMLEQLEIDCSKPGNVAACKLLQDKNFLLPITANFEGNNYGIGINLAGGWKGFFFTLPMS